MALLKQLRTKLAAVALKCRRAVFLFRQLVKLVRVITSRTSVVANSWEEIKLLVQHSSGIAPAHPGCKGKAASLTPSGQGLSFSQYSQ